MVIKVTIPYHPHPKQLQLHNDTHRFKTVICGRRFGKTLYSVNDDVKDALTDPLWMGKPNLFGYIAPLYKQAKSIAWDMAKFYAPRKLIKKTNESELSITFVNGSTYRLFGADNPDSLRGLGFRKITCDEFADFKRNVWDIIRPTLTERKGRATFLGTPKGKQNLLYEMAIRDPEWHDADYRTIDGQAIPSSDDFKTYRFLTVDNPYIDKSEVEKARGEMIAEYFRQEYEASFENYTGIVYKEYAERHNINVKLESFYNIYVGIDTGRYSSISFVAVDDKKRCYVFDEIYDFDSSVDKIVDKIKQKLLFWRIEPVCYVIDSASQVKREYERCGIYPEDSQKDLENSITMIRTMFQNDNLFFDIDRCPMHKAQHAGYIWSDKLVGVNKRPLPVKENDHTVSSLQYIINRICGVYVPTHPTVIEYRNTIEYKVQQYDRPKRELLG